MYTVTSSTQGVNTIYADSGTGLRELSVGSNLDNSAVSCSAPFDVFCRAIYLNKRSFEEHNCMLIN